MPQRSRRLLVPVATTLPLAAGRASSVWMCAAAPVGPNIHANQKGYATIAAAFAAVLPRKL